MKPSGGDFPDARVAAVGDVEVSGVVKDQRSGPAQDGGCSRGTVSDGDRAGESADAIGWHGRSGQDMASGKTRRPAGAVV